MDGSGENISLSLATCTSSAEIRKTRHRDKQVEN